MNTHQPELITDIVFPAPAAHSREPFPPQLILPPGEGRCPLAVSITDGREPARDVSLLTDAGFAVLTTDVPQERLERDAAAFAAWEQEFTEELQRILDENPRLLADRVSIDGWPAALLSFHGKHYRAVVQRPALLDRAAAWGCCAAGQTDVFGDSLADMLTRLTMASVLAEADAASAPVLLVCDMGNPLYSREQSELLYSALKDRHPELPCRLAVFPEGPAHGTAAGMNAESLAWLCRFGRDAHD